MSPVLIYHFQSSQNQEGDFKPASYRVVYFFGSEGFFEMNLLKEMAKSVPLANYEDLNFLSLDDLRSFALRVAAEIKVPEIKLISVQDYNIGIDGAKDLESFKTIFDSYGEGVENIEAKPKKGLFGKIFS